MTPKILPAIYETQRDNILDPGVTCAVTTLSMLIQSKGFYVPSGVAEAQHIEDEILTDLKNRFTSWKSLREDFNFLAKYAKDKYSLPLKYKGYNKNDWLAKIARNDRPFMTSTSNALTSFGHIVLSRGFKVEGEELLLCFNDPYGCHPYKDKKSGEEVFYKASQFPFDDGEGTEKTYHTLSYDF